MAEYIEREALLAEYDRVHVGPPGGARKLIEEAPAADVAPVVHGLYIVNGDKLPPNPCGALTLSTRYIGKHENGWEIVADIHEDYYEWVNEFVAYRHGEYPREFVAGDFESVVIASSEKAYEEFLNLFPPEAWDYCDI